MKGAAVRVLDDRYLEFIAALQKLGEFRSVARMIVRISGALGTEEELDEDIAPESLRPEVNRAIHALWKKGWIEVREIRRVSKYGPKKDYRLKVCLDRIENYFEQERISKSVLAGHTFRAHGMAVPA